MARGRIQPALAVVIDLGIIRQRRPHFHRWMLDLQALGQPTAGPA
jgi:hypothetical protein